MIEFSCIIPCKSTVNNPKLDDLIQSIKSQQFPQSDIEIITVTDGDSESAKAIGIRKAKGRFLCMLCDDNYITDPSCFETVQTVFDKFGYRLVGVYSSNYAYFKKDNSLNRYFSLMGFNDPIAFYLKKNDRIPFYENDENEFLRVLSFAKEIPSLGDNGFFVRREHFLNTNLDHYYPMDNCEDLRKFGLNTYARITPQYIWHRTSTDLFSFLKKRYKYAKDLYCDRRDRRWKIISTRKDYLRLAFFVLATLSLVQPLYISTKGYRHNRDLAWFWHLPVCLGFLIMYGVLTLRCLLKSALSFRR